MAARKVQSGTPANDDDFDAILREAEARIAERTSDLKVEEATEITFTRLPKGNEPEAPAPQEATPPVPSRSRSRAQSTALAPKPVTEPARVVVTEKFSLAGMEMPLAVEMTDRPLSVLEGIIQKGMETVVQVGAALIEINVRGLYKEAGYKTFPEYTRDRWDISKSRAHQVMQATKNTKALEDAGVPKNLIPTNEATLRQLTPVVNTGSAADIIATAREAAKLGGGKATAESTRLAVQNVTGVERPVTSSAPVTQRTAAARAQSAQAARANTSAPSPRPATPLAEPQADDVNGGRAILAQAIRAFTKGTFVRADTEKLGTVEMMRLLRKYCELWLSQNNNVVKRIVGDPTGPESDVQPEPGATQQKGEKSADFAKRVLANPKAYDTTTVTWAKALSAVPASKEEADAKAVVSAPVAPAVEAQPAPRSRSRKAPAVSPEAQALMDATVAARPQTGQQQRRASRKATAA